MLGRGLDRLRGLRKNIATGSDVHPQVDVEADLCEQAQAEADMLHHALDQLPLGFYIKNVRGEFILVGDQALQCLAAISPLTPNAALQAVHHEVALRIAAEDRLVIEDRETLHREVEVVSEIDGATRWFELSKRPFLNKRGDCIGIVGCAVDITERVDQTLRAATLTGQVAQQNKIKAEFLTSASHDLRQPLQTAFLHVAALAGHVNPEGTEVVRKLETVLHVMRSLLDNLLDMSEIETGSLHAQTCGVPVNDLINHLAATFLPLAANRGLAFTTTSCDEAMVLTDRKLLIRMLSNVIENAITFTTSGTIALSAICYADTLVITVTDTGIGIPPEHLDLIWNEFHQVGNPGRNPKNGIGLGLAIVRRLSIMLKHPVMITSTFGEGTTFTLRAPLTAPLTASPAHLDPLAASTASPRQQLIVLVDDDAALRDALELCLTDAGFIVVAASSGLELVAVMTPDQVPDIVLMDYRLEHTLGVIEIVRLRNHFGRNLPSILLTGDIGTQVQTEAKVHDMRIVHKPISIRTLLNEISIVIAEHRY